MEKKINKIFYLLYNTARILFATIILLGFFSDIHGIAIDPDTYEKVYTGAFLGEYRYESLFHLKLSLWIDSLLLISYLVLVILHLTKFKQNKFLSWFLRVADLIIVSYIGYSLYIIYSLN
jgi:uncharacterized membrane protein